MSVPLEWHCEKRKVKDLAPYEHNPRVLTKKQAKHLQESLEEFNLVEIPAINTNNMIIAGHQRLKILALLGRSEEEIDVRVPNRPLTDEEFRNYLLRSNKNVGEWDWEILGNVFEVEELLSVGFTQEELGIDASFPGDDADDEIPEEVKVKVVTEDKDLFEIVTKDSTLRLYCGDCRDQKTLTAVMNGQKAHIACCDFPYNISYGEDTDHPSWANSRGDRTIANDAMTQEEFEKFLTDCLEKIASVCVDGAMAYYWMSTQEIGTLQRAAKTAGWWWSSTIAWVKDRFVMGRKDFHTRHENIFYGWLDNAPRICPLEERTHDDVWEHTRPSKAELHPCLAPDSVVVSSRGYQPISDVVTGDAMYCADGKFHAVEDVTRHRFAGTIKRINTVGTNMSVDATPNHLFLSRTWKTKFGRTHKKSTLHSHIPEIGFVRADELKVGDEILSPMLDDTANSNLGITTEDAFFAGLFLAEGNFQMAGHGKNIYPVFSLHRKETHIVNRMIAKWGKKVKTYPNGVGNGISVFVFDASLGDSLLKICGRGSRTKSISQDVFGWARDIRESFLNGYFEGDGCHYTRLTNEYWIAKTSSPFMAGQLRILAESVGYRASVRRYEWNGKPVKINGKLLKSIAPYYAIEIRRLQLGTSTIRYDGVDYRPRTVRSVQDIEYDGYVVNLSVEGSPTFETVVGMSHNTMKPVALIVKQIALSSKTGNNVIDFFCGSGTTGIACLKTNRNGFFTEVEKRYCDVILRRWADYMKENGIEYTATRNGKAFSIPDVYESSENVAEKVSEAAKN